MVNKAHFNYRDSGTGQYIRKDVAERRDPRTVEKERVKPPSSTPKKTK